MLRGYRKRNPLLLVGRGWYRHYEELQHGGAKEKKLNGNLGKSITPDSLKKDTLWTFSAHCNTFSIVKIMEAT